MRGCLAILIALVSSGLMAQDDVSTDLPAGITLESLQSRLLADDAVAEGVVAEARATDSWSRADAAMDSLTAEVEALARRTGPRGIETLPLSAFVSFDRQWRFVGRRVEAVDREIQDQLAPLAKDAQALKAKREAWEATLPSAGNAAGSDLGTRVALPPWIPRPCGAWEPRRRHRRPSREGAAISNSPSPRATNRLRIRHRMWS